MQNIEFGLDSGESLYEELVAARSLIDGNILNSDAQSLKMPVEYQRLIATTEFLYQVMSSQKPELASRLFKLDAVRKCAYGLDSAALVKTHPLLGIALSDYDSSLINRGLNGEMFTVIDIKKDNRANSLLLVNNMAAKAITQYYPDDFDDLDGKDPIEFIRRTIAEPLSKGLRPTKALQFGLLSGFPRESTRLYPDFDRQRRRFPKFEEVYQQFLKGYAEANNVVNVIDHLNISDKEKTFLRKIIADQARFNDRESISSGGFLTLNGNDLYYAQRREQWFRYLDGIYKPIVQKAARF